jgi:hypothetical protein
VLARQPPGDPARAATVAEAAEAVTQGAGQAAGQAAAQAATQADPLQAWAAAQTDWKTLDDSRALVENAAAGDSVTLLGPQATQINVSADTLAQVRALVRHRLMELLYAQKTALDTQLAAAHTLGDSAGDAGSRLAVQSSMRTVLTPIYQSLRGSKTPELMFEYPLTATNAAPIINAALATGQLIGEGAAEQALADLSKDKAKPHRDARKALGWSPNPKDPSHDESYYEGLEWCGAFASMELMQGGLDRNWPGHLVNTAPAAAGNLDGLFLYLDRVEIKVGDQWQDLATYHVDRGSSRRFEVLPGGGDRWDADTSAFQPKGPATRLGQINSLADLDAQPGDIVLIDNNKGTYGDHITMCRSYDASTHTLWTIGGNEGDAHPVNASAPWALDQNPAPAFAAKYGEKSSRVYAVGRFSAVDFEVHTYRPAPPVKTKP